MPNADILINKIIDWLILTAYQPAQDYFMTNVRESY